MIISTFSSFLVPIYPRRKPGMGNKARVPYPTTPRPCRGYNCDQTTPRPCRGYNCDQTTATTTTTTTTTTTVTTRPPRTPYPTTPPPCRGYNCNPTTATTTTATTPIRLPRPPFITTVPIDSSGCPCLYKGNHCNPARGKYKIKC